MNPLETGPQFPFWHWDLQGRSVLVAYTGPGTAPAGADLCQLSPSRQGLPPALFALTTVVQHVVAPDADDARVLVDINVGNSRASYSLTIDAGQTVVLAGTTINARARTVGVARNATAASSMVHLNVALANSAGGQVVTLTDFPQAVLAAGTSTVYPVPPFARAVSFGFSYDLNVGADLILCQWSNANPFAMSLQQAVGGGALESPRVIVPRGAQQMRIVNGGFASNVQPIWELQT